MMERNLNPNAAEFRPSSALRLPPPPPPQLLLIPNNSTTDFFFFPSYNINNQPHPLPRQHRPSHTRRRLSNPINNPVTPTGLQTTLMIKNIPNTFTRNMLIQFLDNFCNNHIHANQESLQYDFLYLPIDFSTKMNKGYAFVNFTTPKGAWRLHEANMADRTWGYGDSSRKRREIAIAKIQGKSALIKHFEQSRFICESDEYLPICFSPPRDGSSSKQVSQRNIGQRNERTSITSRRKPFSRYPRG